MSFPYHDRCWTETAEFLRKHVKKDAKIIAPEDFCEEFTRAYPYSSNLLQESHDFQWVVIHKGMIEELYLNFLNFVLKELNPIFANEVFVVFSSYSHIDEVAVDSTHVTSLLESIQKKAYRPILQPLDYSSLSTDEIKELMDRRFNSKQPYGAIKLWDEVRTQELNKLVLEMIGFTKNKKILEIGCGIGGFADYILHCQEFVGIDLSDSAIFQAKVRSVNKPNFKFMSMDAMNLEFPDRRFDIVIAKEVIEHIPDPNACVREVFRVLKPNGLFIVTSPNRDSFHLRVNRMLGHSDFKCSFDHIKEFTLREAMEMLGKEGFSIKNTDGAFLHPYWGIPGLDSHVRHLTDSDPQMIEMLRDLGKRVGAEYAFCFVIASTKPKDGLAKLRHLFLKYRRLLSSSNNAINCSLL